MNRRDRTRVARVEELKQVERFSSANFTEDDAVRAVPKRCLQQVSDRDRRKIRLRLASLETDEVWLFELDFRRVLDEENSVLVRNELSQGAQERGLSTARSATNENVLAFFDVRLQPLRNPGVKAAAGDQVFDCEVTTVEFADGERDTVDAARRDHCCDAATIRQTRVEDGLLL